MKKKLVHVVMLVGLLFGSLGNAGVALADSVDALANETNTTETSTVANESVAEETPAPAPVPEPAPAPEASAETPAAPVEEAVPEVAAEEPAEETPAPETPAEKPVETPAAKPEASPAKPAETPSAPAVSAEEPVAEASVPEAEATEEVKEESALNTLASSSNGVVAAVATALSGISTFSAPTLSSTLTGGSSTLTSGSSESWSVGAEHNYVGEIMDILFLIDTSGSMSGARNWVAQGVEAFYNSLTSAGAGTINAGVIDLTDGHEFLGLGNNSAADVSAALVDNSNGYPNPEWGGMDTILDTINNTSWTSGATKIIVLLTDTYMGVLPGSSSTTDYTDIAAAAKANDVIFSIQEVDSQFPGNTHTESMTALHAALQAGGVNSQHYHTTTAEGKDQLQTNLEDSIIAPSAGDDHTYSYTVSYKYQSDGKASTDVNLVSDKNSFILKPGDTNAFNFTATPNAKVNRYNDTTVVTIDYYIDGVKVDDMTEYVYYTVYASYVWVIHADADGNILSIEKKEGVVGDDYTTAPKDFPGYELWDGPFDFDALDVPRDGKFTDEDQFLIYLYNKIEDDIKSDIKYPAPTKPVEPKKPEPKPMKQVSSTVAELPATGEEENMMLFIVGMAMLSLVGGFVIWMKLPKGRHSA